MNEKCPYFRSEKVVLESKSQTGDRNPIEPVIEYKTWCEHPQSQWPKDRIGARLQCEGDLTKCPIE